MRLQSAIFDMDGTLLDSMPAWNHLGSDLLRRHGIDRALWEEAESLLPPEEEIIENYLRAKVRVPPADERERKRLSDSLARRGFSWGAVKSALRRFGAGVEDEF